MLDNCADHGPASTSMLWAKTEPATDRWHALPYHLLDVAATANALYSLLPPASRATADLAFGAKDTARAVSVFLAAAHDVGKANIYFQSKDPRRAASLGITPLEEPRRHGYATGAWLKQWLVNNWNWSTPVASNTAKAVGGHHGTYFAETTLERLRLNDEPWSSFGPALLDELSAVLELEGPYPEPVHLNAYLAWLSGFVCVADWLGSHRAMTLWETGRTPLAAYLTSAGSRAKGLLRRTRWTMPAESLPLPLEQLIPAGGQPNELQRLAERIGQSGFQLAIVEAPTGEGKTEAAFALTEPSRAGGAGVYFALPTMATANGLFERVRGYLSKATGERDVELRLLHSQAWQYRADAATVANPGDEEMTAEAEDWFSGSKRGLLTPYAVGTVDQALLAVLRVRHGFVRLFALAGKTIVVDEVHAYDVYMSDLIERLLGWLRALGCRVILLSATLPAARRAALLKAWGACGEAHAAYPCVTWVDQAGCLNAQAFATGERKPLSIRFARQTEGEPWEIGARRILERVQESGGLGALVLNTVDAAQKAYGWLRANAGSIPVTLFHARFTACDRARIEKDVLKRYGRDGPRDGPAILVATQVVEQSLDLDFDHLVSALAPIDLLIQRAGRLHRHARTQAGQLKPPGGKDERPDPVLEVLPPQLDETGFPMAGDPVYSPDILARTAALLESELRVAQAHDVAVAVEGVYCERERQIAVTAWEQRLEALTATRVERDGKHARKAEAAAIAAADDVDRLITENYVDQDEYDDRPGSQLAARTRLEDRPSITVALLSDDDTTVHGGLTSDLRASFLSCVRFTPPAPMWRHILDIGGLPRWRTMGSLSRVRPLVLSDGCVKLGDHEVSYDSETGLHWRKANAGL